MAACPTCGPFLALPPVGQKWANLWAKTLQVAERIRVPARKLETRVRARPWGGRMARAFISHETIMPSHTKPFGHLTWKQFGHLTRNKVAADLRIVPSRQVASLFLGHALLVLAQRRVVPARVARFNPSTVIIYDKNLEGLSVRPICTRWCFAMTNMIQVCRNFAPSPG